MSLYDYRFGSSSTHAVDTVLLAHATVSYLFPESSISGENIFSLRRSQPVCKKNIFRARGVDVKHMRSALSYNPN